MTSTLARTMLRATLGATLILPSATLGMGCGRSDSVSTHGLGASLAAAPKAKPKTTPKAAPKASTPKAAPKVEPTKIDMSYIFKGTDADRKKLKLAGFKPGLTKEEKLAAVQRIDAIVDRMQVVAAKDPTVELPRTVRDGAAIWNHLSDIEKIDLLETNPGPDPAGPVSNWAAAAVGIAAVAFVYQVAKDEKWINDKDLKEIQIRTFTAAQLDHAATLGNAPLMIPAKQVAGGQTRAQ